MAHYVPSCPPGKPGGDPTLDHHHFEIEETIKAVILLYTHTLTISDRERYAVHLDVVSALLNVLAADPTVTTMAAPGIMDPLYWLGSDGPFGNLVLPGLGIIIFVETGLGFPMLPGDSLLFTAGMLSVQENGFAPLWLTILVAVLCAIAGDQSSYWIGRFFGERLRNRPDGRIFKKAYIQQGHDFFEKYGPVAVILCRFVPIVRTYAPITIGMAKMSYRRFFLYDIFGGLLWAGGMTLLGAWLGNFDFVRKNIEYIFLLIVFISILPGIIGGYKKWRSGRRAAAATEAAQAPRVE